MKTFDKIYQIVAQIPQGKVMTYKQISIIADAATPRVVGFAMRANKDTKNVPCHRVVSIDGQLRGYAFGGIETKREKLKKEGVAFLPNGNVDLAKSQYQPKRAF